MVQINNRQFYVQQVNADTFFICDNNATYIDGRNFISYVLGRQITLVGNTTLIVNPFYFPPPGIAILSLLFYINSHFATLCLHIKFLFSACSGPPLPQLGGPVFFRKERGWKQPQTDLALIPFAYDFLVSLARQRILA